jgi:hypothetical protein
MNLRKVFTGANGGHHQVLTAKAQQGGQLSLWID